MDDGLQNPALAKDFTIAVVDGRRGLGNKRVIPAGPLRATLAFQMALVDAIVVNLPPGVEAAACTVARDLRGSFSGPILTAETSPAGSTQWVRERPWLAWAGIGAPSRFFEALRAEGAQLLETRTFPDHHLPSDGEAKKILESARRLGAGVVTTEKDWVRLRGCAGSVGELWRESRYLPVELRLRGADADRFAALLSAVMAGKDATRQPGSSA
jgi:tetraacyldisaccharide 4'-kinase